MRGVLSLTLAQGLHELAEMDLHGWESSQDGGRVLFSESVVGDLRMTAIEGFTALRRRGLKIVGGLLFGDISSGELRIDGFQPVSCEHRYGPSYVLSDADRENLTEWLARSRSGSPVAGVFRSYTGREPMIEPADEAMVAELFPNGEFVFLMLHPRSAESCVANFRFFRDGQLQPASEEPALEFEPKRMPVMQMVVQEMAPERKPSPEHKPAPVLPPPRRLRREEPLPEPQPEQELVPAPLWASEPAPRRSGWWKTVLLCMAGVLGGAFLYELGWSQRPSQPAPARLVELHLDARPDGGRWTSDGIRRRPKYWRPIAGR